MGTATRSWKSVINGTRCGKNYAKLTGDCGVKELIPWVIRAPWLRVIYCRSDSHRRVESNRFTRGCKWPRLVAYSKTPSDEVHGGVLGLGGQAGLWLCSFGPVFCYRSTSTLRSKKSGGCSFLMILAISRRQASPKSIEQSSRFYKTRHTRLSFIMRVWKSPCFQMNLTTTDCAKSSFKSIQTAIQM